MHYTPNIRSLEIHITYKCNLRCNNCTNVVGLAPAPDLDMSLNDIDNLVQQSTDLHYPWNRLVLHGGEPTYHPEFLEICLRLAQYRNDINPKMLLYVCSNGLSERTRELNALAAKDCGFLIEDSSKISYKNNPNYTPNYHVEFNVSPTDLNEPFSLGCYQTSRCGIALNKLGYYECSPSASMARVFGYLPLAQHLKDVTAERLAQGFSLHCKHCGLSRAGGHEQASPHALQQVTSPTWAKALSAYNEKRLAKNAP